MIKISARKPGVFKALVILLTAAIFIEMFNTEAVYAEEISDLVNENFDAMAVDLTPANWGVPASDTSLSVKVEEETDGNRFLRIRDTSVNSSKGIFKPSLKVPER